jgi:hypothetical protein
MADKTPDPAEGMTEQPTSSNTVINPQTGEAPVIQPQTPDQFIGGEPEEDEKPVDPKHATKGMTSLGYTEASRIENTAAIQEEERKAAEKAAAKD